MGKKNPCITLPRIMEDMIAKRLYVSLLPLDNLLRDLADDIESGVRDDDDYYYRRARRIRKKIVRLLERSLTDEREA